MCYKICARTSTLYVCHLQQLVSKLPSYIKDTTHFLKRLNSIGQLPDGVLVVTLDVILTNNTYLLSTINTADK